MRRIIVCILAVLLGASAAPSNPTFGSTAEVSLEIHDIQGAGHRSPHVGQPVTTTGIVIAKSSNGFWIQDPEPDSDPATSEGLFVFGTAAAGLVTVGDLVYASGTVAEFRAGGSTSANLTTTELASPVLVVQSHGNALPAPTIIGTGGRIPPTTVIEDDASDSVETSGAFDPATDGIDFYESLEGMLVQVNNAVAVGPRNSFGEIPVLADDGAGASLRTLRGGIVIRPTDFNPERIILDDVLAATPMAKVGDHFSTVVGVMDYSFGNFKLLVTATPTLADGGRTRETTRVPAASVTWSMLIQAIQAAGGPLYQYRQIDPVNNQDGGVPGGNIRTGFLFRIDRGLEFIDRPGGDATTPAMVVSTPSGPQLSVSPGRIDPGNAAWSSPEGVRKPLVGEFRARGKKLFVIANHWKSKTQDNPLFGRFQPPVRGTEAQRNAEAQVVRDFVSEILALDPNANVIVLGDLNDFQFSDALTTLKGSGDLELHALIEILEESERYTYVFDGNSQVLDHILFSDNLFTHFQFEYAVVHVNSEFPDQASDHEPQVVRLDLRGRPSPKP